jgi:hypothetical protein
LLRQPPFQRVDPLLEPLVIGKRHGGDTAHHADNRREQRASVVEQQRGANQEGGDAAEPVRVSRSQRMTAKICDAT